MSRVKNHDPICRTLTKEDIKRSWLSPVPSHTYAIQLDGLILLEGSTGDYVFHNEKVCFSTSARLKNGQIITFLRAEEVE